MKIKVKSKYAERRRGLYPPLEEQLDALWHGMNEDPKLRVEPFYSMIKEVKDKEPKC